MDQNTSRIPLIIGIVVVLAVASFGTYAFMQKDSAMTEDNMTEDTETMMKEEGMMQGEGDDQKDAGEDMMKSGSYEVYAPEKLARAETGDVVLFFHASWCPSCRGLNADIEQNLSAIPAGVSILKVDYDTETELKKKYGVTYQHTLVQVSADGTLIKKWSGSASLSSLVSQVN